ncbi:uncharacterized protein LOC123681102 [Harmonia axyridis]|uniref:uncharacterized protein LOC123681102 n=1 Tax=Harmonia axyridis TaxID=115357 RepID=UPI001E279CFC|nr:uncharacterized protein LOC123681102 [Harmonia axyridis]
MIEFVKMASGDDDRSEDESVRSDKSSSVIDNYYKCCSKKACTIQVCINCEGIFHGSCVKKKNFKVLSKRHIECCDKIPDENKKLNKEEILELKIEYLSKLLAECQDKIDVLKENNSLLKENNRLLTLQLNSIHKKSETKSESQYANVVKRVNNNDVKKIVPNVPQIVVQTSERSDMRPNPKKHNLSILSKSNVNSVNENIINSGDTDNYNQLETAQRKKMEEVINLGQHTDSINNRTHLTPENQEEWRTMHSRKKRKFRPTRFGTCKMTEDIAENSFVGQKKRAWFFISRVKAHVTEPIIEEYIRKKPGFAKEVVEIKQLNFENKKSAQKSFLVKVPFTKKDELYKPEFWPENVVIK